MSDEIFRKQEGTNNNFSQSNKSNFLEKVPKHNWAIATYILTIVAVILAVNLLTGTGMTGKVISESKIESQINNFINTQLLLDGGAQIESISQQSGLYVAMVNLEGDILPLYFTKDGNFISQGRELMPINSNVTTSPEPSNPTPSTPQDIPKQDKPKVELFIMSHCPYGTQIEKGMIPVVETLGDKIDFDLKFVYYAMHGEVEVYEQLAQYCIEKEQNEKFIPYLKCFLQAGDSESCLTQIGIDQAKLKTCVDKTDKEFSVTDNLEDQASWLSGRFPLFDIDKTENEKYGVAGSPTLVVNGVQVSSGRDSASLLASVCAGFNEAPEECQVTLSSASPSAGFGYGTASGSTDSAVCG
jgi:hypothetical protein